MSFTPNSIFSERTVEILKHGISGGLGAFLSTCILYPILNIKMRMQVLEKDQSDKTSNTIDNTRKESRSTKSNNDDEMGAIETLKVVLRTEGIIGLYKGLITYAIGMVINFGAYFCWYELFKGIFIGDSFNVMGYIITSFLAGTISTILVNPIWVINARILVNKKEEMSLLYLILIIIKSEGISAMFKGLGASIILVSNPIIQFVIYEFAKEKYSGSAHASLIFFLAGAFSKVVATVVTYPYQTIKFNLQAFKGKNLSQWEMSMQIYKKRGLIGFFSGLSAKLWYTAIHSALMLLIYEQLNTIVGVFLMGLLLKN